MKIFRIILSLGIISLLLISAIPIHATSPVYEWVNAIPRQTDDTNFEWVNGVPFIFMQGASAPPDISNSPTSKAWGVVSESSTYYAGGGAYSNPVTDGQCAFTITNNGSSAVKIQIKTTNATGGVGWTAVATSPSTNEFRQTAVYSGLNPASGVVLTTSDQDFIASLAGSATKKWDYKLDTGQFTDGVQKSWTVTITASAP